MKALRAGFNLCSRLREKQHQIPRVNLPIKQMEINRQKAYYQNSTKWKKKGNHQYQYIGERQLLEIIERANKAAKDQHLKLVYQVEKTQETTIKLVRTENNQIIKEIPAGEVMDFINTIWQFSGLLVKA